MRRPGFQRRKSSRAILDGRAPGGPTVTPTPKPDGNNDRDAHERADRDADADADRTLDVVQRRK